MNAEGTSENWQIETAGEIIDADFDKITQLISRGDLLRMDRVRNGDLRWIEAGKVPSLVAVFNAKDDAQPAKPVVTLTKLGSPSGYDGSNQINTSPKAQYQAEPVTERPVLIGTPICSIHADVDATYICVTCFSHFCNACPTSYGGTVKACPFCGAFCENIVKCEPLKTQTATDASPKDEGLGFGDRFKGIFSKFR
jgi:hypothetical protein